MFTGLVQHVGNVHRIEKRAGGARLFVDIGPLAEGAALGDSIASNGACLTITSISGSIVSYDVSNESLRKTTLGDLRPNDKVNCEPALAIGDRLGGHIVSGHVDGVGSVSGRQPQPDGSEVWRFRLPNDGSVKVVEKGSVTLDGISLTTYDCRAQEFSVALIPHTIQNTSLSTKRIGSRLNMEQDVIGRWVLTHGVANSP